MVDIPGTTLGVDLSSRTLISIALIIMFLFLARIGLLKALVSKKISKKRASGLALYLNYIGTILLIFSALPSTSTVGDYPILVSFLPTFFGLLPIMLAFEIEKSLR